MIASYQPVDEFPGWQRAPEFFASLFREYSSKNILEVGSGSHPTFSADFVQQSNLSYVTSDIDPTELERADPAFERLVLDLSLPMIGPALTGTFDCVLSRMVGEHINGGRQFHENVYKVLRPGGISAHCFSTLWALPFVINRFTPEALSHRIADNISPRDKAEFKKFKAYYDWSRGPTKTMIRRFQRIGFEIIRYTGYFGHNYYAPKIPLLDKLERQKTKFLVAHPVPQLCSYATLILRKPK